ncbi:hypothetical protein B0H14DRAFT_2516942 [Mycena olivaceomarginata]|nr:hypothetical protein B0H14DRAFT_2516942 [Mycena olivaceomarginata]
MSEIFVLTLEPRECYHDGGWIDDRAGTLLLCEICSTWRAIAIRTPALWNTLSLSAEYAPRPLDWISTWLGRSRSFPMCLQLVGSGQALRDLLGSVISTIHDHLHHIAELEIEDMDMITGVGAGSEAVYPNNPPVESLDAPLLSNVHVELPSGKIWDWIRAACRASPGLTHLTISQFALDWFPVASLTELSIIDPLPMSTVFQIFEHASNLKDVYFNVKGPAATSSPTSRLGMKSISLLEITSDLHLGEFLEQIELPSLVELRVYKIHGWPEDEFHSFLDRSSCGLTNLEFNDCSISQEQIVLFLGHKACNALESFALKQCNTAGDALLEQLTYYGPEHPPCYPQPQSH